ncbi:MAG: tRNA uridine-5-carboxymethylaminomethyl(34) synthesis GTPase MnmE, partial [Ignavibacteria bacterium]|nr:tRNA uridine-5-carboxymethylaminomethyl(34) synthesis GTPase MnmE [Ignavibacteria bacterium]
MIVNDDPICAIITPPGVGAINVIRISGKNSIEICDKIFVGKISLINAKSHTIHYGIIGENLDDVLVSVFKAPNSYTGEDSVEISCHGSSLIAYKIIDLLCKHGARLAEAGEFTKRAFINGKLDLIQAEAVAELIRARSDNAVRGARNQLDGLLSKKIKSIKDELIESLGLVELELDFAEENFEFIDKTVLLKKVENIIVQLDELISSFKIGKTIFDGIHTAIVGKPN